MSPCRVLQGAVATNITIDVVCSAMTNFGGGSSLDRFAQVNGMLLQAYNQSCLDYKYEKYIKVKYEALLQTTHAHLLL